MKTLILYLRFAMMMGIAIAINSCEKEDFESVITTSSTTIGFNDNPYMIFTVSLNKSSYVVGEMARAMVSVNAANFDYRGVVTIAGSEGYFFDGEQFYERQFWSYSTSVETTPGNYNADFAVTKYTYILGIKITKTKEVSIPYEVK